MGVSDSQMLVSDKDLNVMKLSFVTRPTLEFQDHDQCPTEPPEDPGLHKMPEIQQEEEDQEYYKQDEERDQQGKEDKHDDESVSPSSIGVRILSLGEFRDMEVEDDGFKTPTSLDHKIPVVLKCPPAPRKLKPKAVTTKRKAARQRIPLDLSNEIESLFPSTLQIDLSGKIKKIREGDETR